MNMRALITQAYVDEQKALHAMPKGYGGKGRKWADGVLDVAQHFGASSILDYGCGQGSLASVLRERSQGVRIDEYDPAIPGKDGRPSFADMVVCTDVIEHVEPECLEAVLQHIRSLARKVVFMVVATRPSGKTLSDGRNAHLIIETPEWWQQRILASGFTFAETDTPKSPELKVSREWVGVLLP